MTASNLPGPTITTPFVGAAITGFNLRLLVTPLAPHRRIDGFDVASHDDLLLPTFTWDAVAGMAFVSMCFDLSEDSIADYLPNVNNTV